MRVGVRVGVGVGVGVGWGLSSEALPSFCALVRLASYSPTY